MVMDEQYDLSFAKMKKTSDKTVFTAYLGQRLIGYGAVSDLELPYFEGVELTEEGMYLIPYAVLADAFLTFLHANGYPVIYLDTEMKEYGEGLGFTMVDANYGVEPPLFRFAHQR